MPIIKSAKKAVRGSIRKKTLNDRQKRMVRDVIKKFQKLAKTDKKKAEDLLGLVFATVDKAAKRGVIKKNNAARRKSRLSKLLK